VLAPRRQSSRGFSLLEINGLRSTGSQPGTTTHTAPQVVERGRTGENGSAISKFELKGQICRLHNIANGGYT
jgi:hypothetical protein